MTIFGRMRRGFLPAVLLLVGLLPAGSAAQSLEGTGTVATGLLLRQLDGVKRVLMIGAHPDDESTSLLATLSRGWGVETAYLALTRGDGGQNLIGPELWEGLGMIRTGELEAARRLDGGRQFFTRAFDFGYSKSAEEALSFWPREELLHDVVWVVRKFRPHVIVTVFTGTPRDGHGQHQAAGIMAREAYRAAGDPQRFPEQLELGVEAWAPAKLVQSAWRSQGPTVPVQTGRLDPLLGRSHHQLAMESRSQHRSQDMGSPRDPGPRQRGIRVVESRVGEGVDQGLFDGIDTTLVGLADHAPPGRVDEVRNHLTAYRDAVARARDAFGLEPEGVARELVGGLTHLRAVEEAVGDGGARELRRVVERKIELAQKAIMAAAGIVIDVRANDDLVVPGQEVDVTVQLWNGGSRPLTDASVALDVPGDWSEERVGIDDLAAGSAVPPGGLTRWRFYLTVPEDAEPSRLYHLEAARDGAMYRWPDEPELWGLPRDPARVRAVVSFGLGDGDGEESTLRREEPWRYVGVDQAHGEFDDPVLVVPRLSAGVAPRAMVWPTRRRDARTVTVSVRNDAPDGSAGSVRLETPEGWRATPAGRDFELAAEGAGRAFTFQVAPESEPTAGERTFQAVVRAEDGTVYTEGFSLLDYEHIERSALYEPATVRATVVDVRVAEGLRVGYVMGTGDDGPDALRQLGVDVELLGPDQVRDGDFDGFDALVLGVRAYETRPDVRAANAQLLDFARAGGTLVLQYNQYQFSRGEYAPYPLEISRPAPRVADETAEVTILRPDAPVFNSPNRITDRDFEGWVQERGLYFLNEWDERYAPLLEMNDPGEPPRRGSLVVAPVGEGLYVYAALSFFRQFPAGVPGAYRLFANLVSLTADDWREYDARAGSGS